MLSSEMCKLRSYSVEALFVVQPDQAGEETNCRIQVSLQVMTPASLP